ncbi:hypothetical protein MKEN_01327600 [Mycena kentingensis (nom. inval.)]|nr:hypothetical protein MKEN_01327600 [Mycena kentingensis (nom. inval.)]
MDDRFPPELLDSVAGNLDAEGQALLSRTSRALYAVCIRRLYHSVKLSTPRQTLRFFKTVANNTACAQAVKRLHTQYWPTSYFVSFSNLVLAGLTHLTALQVLFVEGTPGTFELMSGITFPFLRACSLPPFGPNTMDFLRRHICIRRLQVGFQRHDHRFTDITSIELPQLSSFGGDARLLVPFLAASHIEELLVDWQGTDPESSEIDYCARLAPVNTGHPENLRLTVQIVGGLNAVTPLIHALAIRCPALEGQSSADDTGTFDLQRFVDQTGPAFTKLRSLSWFNITFLGPDLEHTTSSSDAAALSSCLPAVKQLGSMCPALFAFSFQHRTRWLRPWPNVWLPRATDPRQMWDRSELLDLLSSNYGEVLYELELGATGGREGLESVERRDAVVTNKVAALLQFTL